MLTATGLWAAGAEETPAAAADKKYVTDPSTGKVYTAPEYGGIITFAKQNDGSSTNVDLRVNGGAMSIIALVTEKLATPNWALVDRNLYVFGNGAMTPVSELTGTLAES